MKNKGMWFSLEATLSLIVLTMLLLSVQPEKTPSLENIHIVQKEHDLLLLWAKNRPVSIEEMETDFGTAFPEKNGELELGEFSKTIGIAGKEAIASEAIFFDSTGKGTVIAVKVFT